MGTGRSASLVTGPAFRAFSDLGLSRAVHAPSPAVSAKSNGDPNRKLFGEMLRKVWANLENLDAGAGKFVQCLKIGYNRSGKFGRMERGGRDASIPLERVGLGKSRLSP